MIIQINVGKFWAFIKRRVSEIAQILVSIFAMVLLYIDHELTLTSIESLILIALSLSAFSQITNEWRLENTISKFQSKNISAENFMFKRIDESHITSLKEATSIDLMGISLCHTFRSYSSIIEERLQMGANVRILLLNPKKFRSAASVTVSRGNNEDLKLLYANFDSTIRKINEIIDNCNESISLEIRQLDYPPSFGMSLIGDGRKGITSVVKLYAHDGILEGIQPLFELNSFRDGWWHKYFVHQFKVMWDESSPLNI